MKTYSPKPQDKAPKWCLIDAEDQILGRVATVVADRLRGKHKPEFAPHIDMGDFVIVVNADKMRFTGRKLDQKKYYRHTGYPGGIKERTLAEMMASKPEEVVRKAVRGMLPKNRLSRQIIRKLKIYVGGEHPHEAQQPEALTLS